MAGFKNVNFIPFFIIPISKRRNCVLSTWAASKIITSQKYGGALKSRLIENELLINRSLARDHAEAALIQIPPSIKQVISKPKFFNWFEVDRWDDLIGIDIISIKWGYYPLDTWIAHEGSEMVPWIAVNAAMIGLIKWVLPKLPCLPSKFLLEVEAHLS